MFLFIVLIMILCISILLVKDINPQVKAVARNFAIMLSILLVVMIIIGAIGFMVSQRRNSLRLRNSVDYMVPAQNK